VAKVGGRAPREATALRRLGRSARRSGAVVPECLWSGEHHGVPVLAQQALKGESWSRRLAADPRRLPGFLESVAAWLGRWNSASVQPTALTAARLESLVLVPARRVCAQGAMDHLLRSVQELCARCQDQVVPLVGAHNDLTAANLLSADGDRLGIIDWEESREGCLPLGDLAYVAVDAVAAADAYRYRAAAFAACFRRPGAPALLTRRLLAASAAALQLSPDVVELCLQACWLGHAANELERDEGAEGAFNEIIADIARRPTLLGHG
jgi:hypothetical protein